MQETIKAHKRIIFNGNGYEEAWVEEAEKRGLLNLKTTPDALPYFYNEKNRQLFTEHKVLSEEELYSRYEIMAENYRNVLHIEAMTMVDMARKDILPAVSRYIRELAATAQLKNTLSADVNCSYEMELVKEMSALEGSAYARVKELEQAVMGVKEQEGSDNLAVYYRDTVFVAMNELRVVVDALETMTAADSWPYPSYGDLLFSVK